MKKGIFASEKNGRRAALRTAVALALISFTGSAFADPAVTMAPPIDSGYSQPTDSQSYDNTAGQDSVFQWQEVPTNQQVPIRRAVFDQGGYQLYDSQGETIVIPFTDNNLYVMKFARSTDGTTYFVNGGDAPILYIPHNGFLENAAVPGARWYPFSQDFHPAEPVFLGVAPSWDDYITMGWYPDMVCYGGYWGYHPYVTGSVFFPSFGLSFVIGGHHYDGWDSYHRYYSYHPAPYRVRYINRNIYRFDGRSYRDHDFFRGTGHPYEVHRDFNNDRRFGDNRGFGGRQNSGDRHDFAAGRDNGGGRIFRGTGHPTYAHRDYPGSRDIPSGQNGGDRTNNRPVFSGGFGHSSSNSGNARVFSGGSGSGHSFPSNTGDHSFGRSGDNNRTFGGGGNNTRTFGGGDNTHNFAGHDSPNTGRVGGERPSSSSSPRTFSGGFGHSGGGDRSSTPRSGGNDRPSGGNRSDNSHSDNSHSDNSHSSGGDHSGGGDHGGRH